MKPSREWRIDVPWGKLAVVSWGEPCNPPVLMVHGYLDSAATFIPLVEMLPDSYHYVALDFPGHGRSDPLPIGQNLSHGYYIHVLSCVVDYFKWDKFITVAHSVGCFLSMLYNNIYPNKISKMINIDAAPALTHQCNLYRHPSKFYTSYETYYDSTTRMEERRTKQFTYEEALRVFTKGRKVNREQAAILISRSLVPLENGKYRISREPGVKTAIGIPLTKEAIIEIISGNTPPTLNINAATQSPLLGHQIMADFSKSLPFYLVRTVEGAHDLHVTNPEDFVRDIEQFLCKEFNKAKL